MESLQEGASKDEMETQAIAEVVDCLCPGETCVAAFSRAGAGRLPGRRPCRVQRLTPSASFMLASGSMASGVRGCVAAFSSFPPPGSLAIGAGALLVLPVLPLSLGMAFAPLPLALLWRVGLAFGFAFLLAFAFSLVFASGSPDPPV